MSEKLMLDRKIGFRNAFYTKCINAIIDSIGPSIILRSIFIYTRRLFIVTTKKLGGRTYRNIPECCRRRHVF